MGFFKKKSGVLDLTTKQSQRLMKESREMDVAEKAGKEPGVLDLSSPSGNQESEDASGLGFLSGLAGAETTQTGTRERLRVARTGSLELDGLKNKFEDLEYKFGSLMEKIARIEERLGL